MRGLKFLIVFVFGLLGLNESFSQIFVTELFPTRKDSLYDYQIYQQYYWWAYYPGLCGYTWAFQPLNGQLQNTQLSALGYFPQLNYFNCACEFSYYTSEPNKNLYWHSKRTKYIYGIRNSGRGRNNEFVITISSEQIDKVSINKIESDLAGNHDLETRRVNEIDERIEGISLSKKSSLDKEVLPNESVLQAQQSKFKQEAEPNKTRDTNPIELNPRKIESQNYQSISEKIQNDFKLSGETNKVYVVDKPKHKNVWKHFQYLYSNQTSHIDQNRNTGRSYNKSNNTQRSYYSGSEKSTQRNNSTQNSSRRSNVSTSKTRVVE